MSMPEGGDGLLQSLGELFLKNEAGEAELGQIFAVLLQREEYRRGGKRNLVTPTRLGPGEWLAGRTFGVCRPLSRKDAKKREEQPLTVEQMKESRLQKRIAQVIVADPHGFSDADLEADSDIHQLTDILRKAFAWNGTLTIWNARRLQELLCSVPPLCLHYYPELLPSGPERRRTIEQSRLDYNREFAKLHGKIQFVGMSVYKEEASASVEMDKIYIPLQVVPEGAVETDPRSVRANPLRLLSSGERHVILGDPGSGKSTLLRFLALAGGQPRLREQYDAPKDDRLPVLITLRRYADELKSRPDLSLAAYMPELAHGDFACPSIDLEFFEYYLLAGQAIVLLDGLDELPSSDFKLVVRDRVTEFLLDYPGNTVIVTSRIVGYDKEVRYDKLGFSHHRVARLSLEDIKSFVQNWYGARGWGGAFPPALVSYSPRLVAREVQ